MAQPTIPIRPLSDGDAPAPPGGCGLCNTPLGAAACHQGLGRQPCLSPRLAGPPEAVARALEHLRGVADPEAGGNIVDGGLIQSLELDDGEAELTLVAGITGCAIGNLIAEEAFLALRSALPDTDIYVHHDRINPWRSVFSPDDGAVAREGAP